MPKSSIGGIVLEKDTNNVLTGCGRKPVFFSAGKGNKKAQNHSIPGFVFQLAEEWGFEP
ncbi:MAG: hypothetical protein VZR78_05140 [Candidatus Enteromonas sp.]|nr:hypothetical protein [Candidatus Enteromonas sp.]